MDKPPLVSVVPVGETVHLRMSRPPLNFLNLELLRQFEECLESLSESPACRVLIVDSESGAFSAGLDIKELTREAVFLLLEQYHRVATALNGFPRPTLALVRGLALGAGSELVSCCDFAFASERASFGHPEIKVGAIPSLASLVLPQLVGPRKTVEMILTGCIINSEEAARIGLINRAVPESRLLETAGELISVLRPLPGRAVELALQAARAARTRALEGHMREMESLYLNEFMDEGS